MIDCIQQTGKALNLNNQDIVKYLCGIEEERKNLEIIIQKQYQERKRIEAEIERLTYKLCLLNKSLSMRIKAKNNYDKTIEEIKSHYEKLVEGSNKLKQIVEKSQQELDDIMNKKTGTGPGPEGEEIKMLYVKSGDPDECPCYVNQSEIPTKEKPAESVQPEPPAPPPESADLSKPSSQQSNSTDLRSDVFRHNIEPGQKNYMELGHRVSADKLHSANVEEKLPISNSGAHTAFANIHSSLKSETAQLHAEEKATKSDAKGSPQHSVQEYDYNQTGSDGFFDHRDPSERRRSTERSKNLLLSRLKSVDQANSKFRQSALEPVGKEPRSSLEHDQSHNKLLKRSLDDVFKSDE